MDTFQTAMKFIRPGCFMASIDLKDAYYSIPVADEERKFLMFDVTKALKPVYSHLRGLGVIRTHLYGSP